MPVYRRSVHSRVGFGTVYAPGVGIFIKRKYTGMKKVGILLIAAFAIAASAAQAQDYRWAVGIRAASYTTGLTVKRTFGANAIEGMLVFPYDSGFNFGLIYERRIPVISDGFGFYYGGGMHIGSWDHDFNVGIDAIVGLEYKLRKAPVAFSVDYKPMYDFAKDSKFRPWSFGLGAKFVF